MEKYDQTVASSIDGKPIQGAQANIYSLDDPSNPTLATVYADEAGTVPMSQPILTDQLGYFAAYVPDGAYDVRVMAGSIEISRTNIKIVDSLALKQRALLVPMNEDSGTLPPAGERAGKLLGFDDDGNTIAQEISVLEGPPGTSDNTYGTLSAFKASDVARKTASLVGVPGVSDGRFNWTLGNFAGIPAQQLDVNVIKANAVPLTAGAWVRQLGEQAYLRTFGADPTGATSSSAAFTAALAAGKRVIGAPGDVYLLGESVISPDAREIVGNGASMKIAPGVIGLRLQGDRCTVSGWTIVGNGGLYAVLNTGRFNEFSDNLCTGNIGHYFFSSGAQHVIATRNRVDGLSADTEITTAIVAENCKHITVSENQFRDIPVGWAIQIRSNSEDFVVSANECLQTQYSDTKIATTGQKVFTFTLPMPVFLRKVQLNGMPTTTGYTMTGSNPYTVTFDVGRIAGVEVKLVGYRGAENIQINTGSKRGTIVGNSVNGTADSGIIAHGSDIAITGNKVHNCGYVGIAIYGDQDNVSVTGNVISDCAQMDDGLSSPDFPDLPSVFAGAILASGNNATITGNTITNGSGTMRYGIRINKSDMTLVADGGATMVASANAIRGTYPDGKIFAPNDTTGQRVNSVQTDGAIVAYPEQYSTDWDYVVPPVNGTDPARPAQPKDTLYYTVSGSDGTRAMRDQATKRGGVASLRTVAGQYVDFTLTAASMLFGTNVEVTFWAKANGGLSYFEVYTELRDPKTPNQPGLLAPIRAEITDTDWRQYTIRFPFTPNLYPERMFIRMGATSESANFQHIQINGRRL